MLHKDKHTSTSVTSRGDKVLVVSEKAAEVGRLSGLIQFSKHQKREARVVLLFVLVKKRANEANIKTTHHRHARSIHRSHRTCS